MRNPFEHRGRPAGSSQLVLSRVNYATRRKTEGATYAQIGRELKISRQRVCQLLGVPVAIRARKNNCEICGSPNKLHFHHLNYKTHEHQVLCTSCHTRWHGQHHTISYNNKPKSPKLHKKWQAWVKSEKALLISVLKGNRKNVQECSKLMGLPISTIIFKALNLGIFKNDTR